MTAFVCKLALLFFSAQALAFQPTLNDRQVTVTGFGQTNAWRGTRTPVFSTENGVQIDMAFLSPSVTEQWKRLTANGRRHMKLIGVQYENVLYVGWIEPLAHGEPKTSLGALKFEADRAWNTVLQEILKNRAWSGRRAPASSKHEFGMANAAYPNLMSHLVHPAIDSAVQGEEGFLHALIAVGRLAQKGITEPQIENYLNTVNELLALTTPHHFKEYLAKLQNKICEPMLSPEAKAAALRRVVSSLEQSF